MENLVYGLLTVAGGIGIPLLLVRGLVALSRRPDEDTMAALGLVKDPERGGYRGRIDGVRVHVASNGDIKVSGRTPLDPAVRISSTGLFGSQANAGFLIGDSKFDEYVYLDGPPTTLAAMLSPANRERLQDSRVEVEGGALTLTPFGRDPDAVHEAIGLFKALRGQRRDEPRRLLANARRETQDAVRLTMLNLLFEHFPESSAARQAIVLADAFEHHPIRVRAACARRRGKHDALRKLVMSAELDVEVRLLALKALGPLLRGRSAAETRKLLHATTGVVQGAVAEMIATVGIAGLRDDVRRAGMEATGIEAVGFCRAWVIWNDRTVQDALLQMLDPRWPAEVSLEAARALAALGDLGAVQPLLVMTRTARAPVLKSEARRAIVAIQERAGGAEAGDLSLAQPTDDGDLSLVQEEGELALTEARRSSGPPSDAP